MKLAFIEAGEVVTTHGIRGEVKVLPWTDGPEFLVNIRRVRIEGKDYSVERCRVQKGCNLVKLCGIDDPEAAMLLKGKTVEVYREDVPGDVIFASEILDMEVYAQGTCIGKITDVLDYPGNRVYEIKGTYEYLIPAVKEYILSTSLEDNRMEVKLIEGMRTDED